MHPKPASVTEFLCDCDLTVTSLWLSVASLVQLTYENSFPSELFWILNKLIKIRWCTWQRDSHLHLIWPLGVEVELTCPSLGHWLLQSVVTAASASSYSRHAIYLSEWMNGPNSCSPPWHTSYFPGGLYFYYWHHFSFLMIDLKEGSAKEPESISFRLWRPYSQNYSTLPR